MSGENPKDDSEPKPRQCRYCGRKISPDSPDGEKYQPFCSERCRLADLDCWLEEEYRIPGNKLDEEADEGPA